MSQIKNIWVISTHFPLCVATAIHNFTWMGIKVILIGGGGVNKFDFSVV